MSKESILDNFVVCIKNKILNLLKEIYNELVSEFWEDGKMNNRFINFASFRYSTIILSGLLILLSNGIFLRNQSAQIKSEYATTGQNLVLGKLAFSAIVGTFSGAQFWIRSANADGSGQITLAGNLPPASDPSWSPDGSKIVYVASGAGNEIYVMNADGTNKTNLTNTFNISESNPSWSATGKIVYERDNQIWTMNADGFNQSRFTAITQPSPTAPAWSADGMKLAFSSGGDIWKINADGSGEQRVTTNTTTDTDPSWLADGAKIVFAKGGSGIAVVNADGTNEINLTNNSSDTKPAWSPDGTTIAFRRDGIYLMDVNGGNQVRIIADTPGTTGTTYNNPAWQPVAQTPNTFIISGRITLNNVSLSGVTVNLSGAVNAATTTDAAGNYQFSGLPPVGGFTVSPSLLNHFFTPPNRSFFNLSSNRIADFSASGVCIGANCAKNGKIAFSRNSEIWTMNADGTNLTNITNSAGIDTDANYSPDGTKIVFTTNRDGNNEIYRMNADGSNPVRLTNNSASDTSPNYSPDGASIVFVSNRDGNGEIYKMNADGSNQARLTNDTGQQRVPEFSPNGQKIVFVTIPLATSRPDQMWVMNADGTNQQQFPNPPGVLHYYNHPSYSPDGTKIIFNYGDDVTNQGTWTMNADGTNRVQFPLSGRSPTYSPDGTKVSFSSPFFSTQGIYTADANLNTSLRLTFDFDELPDWQPILAPRRTPFDFDGDAKADLAIFRPTLGQWWINWSTDSSTKVFQFGQSTDKIVPADYTGDSKCDVAFFRDGNWFILRSENSTFFAAPFGAIGDIPAPGDYDADGRGDLAVFRPLVATWFILRSTTGLQIIQFGANGDVPVMGDYDGDGKTDIGIFRPGNGSWWIQRSTLGLLITVFGIGTDKPVPADYTGDGKTDIAFFRPNNGNWFILRSENLTFYSAPFGSNGDTPAPADFDGDNRADLAIFRGTSATWFIQRSTQGTLIQQFGVSGDKPVQSAFVP
jgi:Tol biopolymer transport system component